MVRYNEELVNVVVHTESSYEHSTTLKYLGAEVLKDGSIDLKPAMPISIVQSNMNICYISNADYRIGFFRQTSSTAKHNIYASFTYARK